MKPRVLIVSPHFPPVNAPDMQRIRLCLPHLVAADWDVTVLTVNDPTPTAPLDPELSGTIPVEVKVVRAACLSRRWARWLGFSNVALRALPSLFLRGCRLLSGRHFDVIYFSTTMFIVLPFGRLWRRLYGVPYVFDLQDPWVTDFYSRPGAPPPPGGWKYHVSRSVARLLEGWSLRQVSQVITVSAEQGEQLRERYPWLRARPFSVLPFGSPDEDLQHLRATLSNRPPVLPPGRLRLAFAGALGPGMLSSVELLFAAAARAHGAGCPVSLHFVGTSYSHHPDAAPATLRLARAYGLEDCTRETPGRLRYFAALQVTLEAEVNLLFGSEDLPFVPSKTLAVLAAARPVLAIAPIGSALVERLSRFGLTCIAFPLQESRDAAIAAIEQRLLALWRGTEQPPAGPGPGQFTARALAERQRMILESVAARPDNL